MKRGTVDHLVVHLRQNREQGRRLHGRWERRGRAEGSAGVDGEDTQRRAQDETPAPNRGRSTGTHDQVFVLLEDLACASDCTPGIEFRSRGGGFRVKVGHAQ